jgi:hypothetical protein
MCQKASIESGKRTAVAGAANKSSGLEGEGAVGSVRERAHWIFAGQDSIAVGLKLSPGRCELKVIRPVVLVHP